jgi:hypothetical protein
MLRNYQINGEMMQFREIFISKTGMSREELSGLRYRIKQRSLFV